MPGGAPADDAGGGGAAGAAMPVQFGQLSKAEMLAIVKEQVRQGMCDKMTVWLHIKSIVTRLLCHNGWVGQVEKMTSNGQNTVPAYVTGSRSE